MIGSNVTLPRTKASQLLGITSSRFLFIASDGCVRPLAIAHCSASALRYLWYWFAASLPGTPDDFCRSWSICRRMPSTFWTRLQHRPRLLHGLLVEGEEGLAAGPIMVRSAASLACSMRNLSGFIGSVPIGGGARVGR
jgi:hypothetical protein